MPEYLAPGVYVEETPFRAKAIEGVPTSTAGFVGAARYGPTAHPLLVTSLAEYEASFEPFGGEAHLQHADAGDTPNFLWHAVRAFFAEGGKRLVVARVFRPAQDDGHARADRQRTGGVAIRARHPGAAGNVVVRLSLAAAVRPPREFDLVWLPPDTAPDGLGPGLHIARKAASGSDGVFDRAGAEAAAAFARLVGADGFSLAACADGAADACVVTLGIAIRSADGRELARWEGLPLDPRHVGEDGATDSLFAILGSADASGKTAGPPLVVEADPARVGDAFDAVLALFGAGRRDHPLDGGDDGARPRAEDFAGSADRAEGPRLGLRQLESIEEVSIVAAPGSSWPWLSGPDEPAAIAALLVEHATRVRYRVALLDSSPGQSIAALRGLRSRVVSSHAALYVPWVGMRLPSNAPPVLVPPSGFVAGLLARVDGQRGVGHALSREALRSATGLERHFSASEQEVLNREGIDALREFPGKGVRVWGERTTSDDPEWKYVNVRRYLDYLEHSIDAGLRWAVFKPNGEALWANLRRAVTDFLMNEWRNGALLGNKAEAAFFVHCDRTTMTQDDIDQGRLVCLVGVAAVKPAEFVIFRVREWTADHADT